MNKHKSETRFLPLFPHTPLTAKSPIELAHVLGWQCVVNREQILDTTEQEDGSILIHVKKQYNDRIDVSEYFD